jgi:hypothetical protein
MIMADFGFRIEGEKIVESISSHDPGIVHTVFVGLAPDGYRRAVWIHPPIPGAGTARKVFHTARQSLRYANRLIRRRCLICEAGGTHAYNGLGAT